MNKTLLTICALLIFIAGCTSQGVLPEMKEFLDSFDTGKSAVNVIEKYSSKPDMIPAAMQGCTFTKPLIVKTEKKNGAVFYTCETKVKKCERSETAVGTTRLFTIGWEKGKIINIECKGPKGGKVEY